MGKDPQASLSWLSSYTLCSLQEGDSRGHHLF